MPEPHERALALVGTPFRPQGRRPETGLDCVGLVLLAFELPAGKVATHRPVSGDWAWMERQLSPWFEEVNHRPARCGDLAVFRLPRSFHFGVISVLHLVHVDTALGRVVTRRLPPSLGSCCKIYRYRGAC